MMTKIPGFCLAVAALIVMAVTGAQAQDKSRFVFDADNVAGWARMDDGVAAQFTPQGKLDFYNFTNENAGKPVDLYVGDLLFSSPTISGAQTGAGFVFATGEDTAKADEIIKRLPPEKEIKPETAEEKPAK